MIVLSGIKPTGRPHLGNYLAMLRPIVELQNTASVSYVFIADYHALTTVRDAEAMRQDTLDMAIDFLAIGLDPERSVLYRQSDLPELHELAWLLTVLCPMGLLERCHAYKDAKAKFGDKGDKILHGLFAYPVLMSADILAVQATHVPVGRDQIQHVEVTRDLVNKFHHHFCKGKKMGEGGVFTLPEATVRSDVAVVPGLDGQKMSKSYNNTIPLFATSKKVRKLMNKIVTDSKSVEEPKDPETCKVFELYKLFATEEQQAELAARYRAGGMGYGEAKGALHEAFEAHVAPLRERREEIAQHPSAVEDILQAGAAKARARLRETLDAARSAVGLGAASGFGTASGFGAASGLGGEA